MGKDNRLGLGDAIKAITSTTQIDKLVDKITREMGIEDCGCDARQEKLNNIKLPFKRK